jgi:predicted protein tyrosine phosphatase
MKFKKKVVLVVKSICKAYLAKKIQEILNKKTIKCEKIPSQGLYFNTTRQISILIRGYNYYLLALDDAIYYTWVIPLKTL